MAIEPADPDVAAMLRLRDGDDLALNELMDRWQRRVVSYLFRLTGDLTIANDLAEETFVQVYQSRDRYRPHGTFSTWLFAISANLFRNLARWRGRHATVSMDAMGGSDEPPIAETLLDPKPNPGQGVEINERAGAVREAILSLPEEQRQVIVLFEYEDLSHAEIAQVVGCTAKAVEARLYRARETLREKLKRLLA